MKTVSKLLAVLAVVGLVTLAGAADKPKGDKKPVPGVRGKFVKVDGLKITLQAKDGEKVVETDAATKIMVDGKEGKLSDLKEGMFVMATPETGIAKEVKAMMPKPKGDKK